VDKQDVAPATGADGRRGIARGTVATLMASGYSVMHGLPEFLAGALAIEGLARKHPLARFTHVDWLLLAGFLVLPIAYALNLAVTGWDAQALKYVKVMVIGAVLFLGLRAAGVPWQVVPAVALGGAVASAMVGADEVFLRGFARAEGTTNPVPFGNIALLYAELGFVALIASQGTTARPSLRAVAVLAIGAGLFAAWLSQSRGGLVAVPFVITVVVARAFPGAWKRTLSVCAVLVLVTTAGLLWEPHLSVRTQQAIDELQTVTHAPLATQNLSGNSVGTRIHMWQVGWRAFTEAPVMGKGYAAFRSSVVEAGVLTKQVNPELLQHRHLHNELINTLAKGGLVGAGSLLFFWGVFFWYFWQASGTAQSMQARLLALAGLATVVNVMLASMTDSMFGSPAPAAAMALTLAVCAGGTRYLSTASVPKRRESQVRAQPLADARRADRPSA
jgi:O-antigen ligase